jgi:hypothetical protein
MNISIRERESTAFTSPSGSSGSGSGFDFSSSLNTAGTPQASTDEFKISAESIKAGIDKEKKFDINSSDHRIEQTSVKRYNNQLNAIKALNESGNLVEMLEKVGSVGDTSNSWGYSLREIMSKAQITRNGKILTASDLAEALKNDKDGKVKESINSGISDIQGSSSFKQKLEFANDKHDWEAQAAVNVGVTATGIAIAKKVGINSLGQAARVAGTGVLKLGSGALRLGGGGLRLLAFSATPVGALVTIGGLAALWALNNTDQGKALKENVANAVGGAWESIPGVNQIDDFVGDIGDNIGYQFSKFG